MSLHHLHPALVHFAIAFLFAGALAESWGLLRGREGAERFGSIAFVLGVLFLVATVASGFLAANTVPLPEGAIDALEDHERAGLVLLGVSLVLLLWKAWHRGALPRGQRAAYATALLALAALVGWVAFLGGALVYEHGVGVRG